MRQDVAAQDDCVAGAERARRLHELVLAQREHHAADEPRVDREADDRNGDHGVAQAGPQPAHDRDGQQDVGKRHQDVGEPHHDRLDPAGVEAADHAEHHANHHGGGRRRHAGEQ